MNGLDYFNSLMEEEKKFIEEYLFKKNRINNKDIFDILKTMKSEELQKILDDWIEKEGMDPTEGGED